MTRLPRWLIIVIATLLLLQPVATGLIGFYRYSNEFFALSAFVLFLVAGLTSILYPGGIRIPFGLAIFNLSMAIAVPLLINNSLDVSARGSHATWYVSGIATLMAVTAIRQHKIIAWIGAIILTTEVIVWGGIDSIFVSGLAGAIALVAAAHAISVGLERSANQAESYLQLAKETEAGSARASAIRTERSARLKSTLEQALPILEEISDGQITESLRQEAKLLEAELRDEIRGRLLVSPRLKSAARQARSRGIDLAILDEGGLEDAPAKERDQIRDRIATELEKVIEGRVTIRAPKSSQYKVTFVASRAGTSKPDIFLKI
jgi:hypothetical protein